MIQWAHQGGAMEAPSNTLRAFAEVVALAPPGLGLELDVHLASGGELVVIHDATTDRTTGHSGTVASMTVDQLARLNAASRWRHGVVDDPDVDGPPAGYVGGPDGDCRVPTLAEVLDLHRDEASSASITIEVKTDAAGRALVDLLQARDDLPAGDAALVTLVAIRGSRFRSVLARAIEIDEPLRFTLAPTALPLLGLWVRAVVGRPPVRTRYARIQLPHWSLRIGGRRIARNLRRTMWAGATGGPVPLAVDVWTVNRRPDMDRMILTGVDGIMTDCPKDLKAAVEAHPVPD